MRTSVLAVCLLLSAPASSAMPQARPDTVRLINPPSLSTPRGYSHVAEVPAGTRLVFIAGQVALDSTGQLIGVGDLRAQAVAVFENLRRALAAAGATFDDVIKVNYYMVDASQIGVLREVRDRYVNRATPPASTLVEVRRLFRDDVLLEVEAVAAVRQR